MAAKHKKQHSTFQAQTAIDPDSVARMSRDVAETIKSPLPVGPFVRFEGAEPGKLLFSIRNWGGHAELMSFCVNITGSGTGSTINTRIQGFKTTQQKYMFIPVSPKQLVGYGAYTLFAQRLGQALHQNDPQCQSALIERPQA